MEENDEIMFMGGDIRGGDVFRTIANHLRNNPRRSKTVRFGLNPTIDKGLPIIHGPYSEHANPGINICS